MGRQRQLLVHRKNEFRKKYAKQRGYNVTVTPCLPVRISLHLVSLRNAAQGTVSPLQEPLKISVSFELIEQAVLSFNAIQTGVKMLQIMPEGVCMLVYVQHWYNIILLGWVDATCPGKSISFLKVEPNDAGDFRLTLSLKVNHDRTWEVVVTDLSLNPDTFTTFPKVVAMLRDLKLILSFLDNMVFCCGNNDAKYDILILKRKGIFMDQSGKYVCALYIL